MSGGISLDTNVLLALWRAETAALSISHFLTQLAARERLVLCGPAYAELYGFYPQLDESVRVMDIQVLPEMPLAAWQRAGKAHAAYTLRRKQSGGGLPRRVLTDYLIGAHASVNSLSLFTLNTADYGDFPEVRLLTL